MTERSELDAVLDAGRVAHIAIVDNDQPYAVPIAYARIDDDVVFHGSTGSRLMRALAAGAPTCLTVTHLDGLVLARSAFESSMNYRSAMVLGQCRVLDSESGDAALRRITEHLLPGRWAHLRPMTAKERAATLVLALPLTEWSLKSRTGDPGDPDADVADPVYGALWAGCVPFTSGYGTPVPAANSTDELPEHLRAWFSH